MVKTPCSQCREHGFDYWSGKENPACLPAKKKNNNNNQMELFPNMTLLNVASVSCSHSSLHLS